MATEPGVKLDHGKPRWELLPLEQIEKIVHIMTFGANKYTDNGWQSVPNAKKRYWGAMCRHMAKIKKGETVDVESGMPHLWHVACNATFLLWFEDNEEVILTEPEKETILYNSQEKPC